MKVFYFIILLGVSLCSFAQHKLEGTWQGLLTQFGNDIKTSYIIFFQFDIDNQDKMTGLSRDEMPNSINYAIKNIIGTVKSENEILFSQKQILEQIRSHSLYWCLSNGTLIYNDSTGYLRGKWNSTNCKRTKGEIILYRSNQKIKKGKSETISHHWRKQFISDLDKGLNALEIRKKELNQFEFKPIYFDHDKSFIRTEYNEYLKNMVRVISSHSDLRIKVIGHTDAVGTDSYNISLSKKRANALKDRFEKLGLKKERVVIDFKGEQNPVATNKNEEGKQLNRRVDFIFI